MGDGRALIFSLRLVPKNLYSRLVGAVVRTPVPRGLRGATIGAFARHYDVAVDEAELPLRDYPSLAAFFTRRLQEGVRPLAAADDALLSPADGRALHGGALSAGRAVQAKGRDYSVDEFLASDPLAADLAAGSYGGVYLSPRDYHRVHSPVTGRITGYLHVPGALWPVNAAGVAHVDRLFCRNERLVTFIDSEHHGTVAVAMVGATAVGRMAVSYDDVVTNRGGGPPVRVRYDEPRPVARGDELGVFHMGSTVVVLTSRAGLTPTASPDGPVLMGQALLVPGGATA